MNPESTNLKVLQGQKTQQNLIAIARQQFAEQGFTATTMDQIIEIAGVTKGALYHHFKSKRDLFEAVYLNVEEEVGQRIRLASAEKDDPWQQLINGCFAYLQACSEPGFQRILRLDGPAALGLETWRNIDQQYGLNRLLPFLEHLASSGLIKVPSVNAFAHQLSGAMNEATFWIAGHSNPSRALAESQEMLAQWLEAIRHSGG